MSFFCYQSQTQEHLRAGGWRGMIRVCASYGEGTLEKKHLQDSCDYHLSCSLKGCTRLTGSQQLQPFQ